MGLLCRWDSWEGWRGVGAAPGCSWALGLRPILRCSLQESVA